MAGYVSTITSFPYRCLIWRIRAFALSIVSGLNISPPSTTVGLSAHAGRGQSSTNPKSAAGSRLVNARREDGRAMRLLRLDAVRTVGPRGDGTGEEPGTSAGC